MFETRGRFWKTWSSRASRETIESASMDGACRTGAYPSSDFGSARKSWHDEWVDLFSSLWRCRFRILRLRQEAGEVGSTDSGRRSLCFSLLCRQYLFDDHHWYRLDRRALGAERSIDCAINSVTYARVEPVREGFCRISKGDNYLNDSGVFDDARSVRQLKPRRCRRTDCGTPVAMVDLGIFEIG